MSDLTQSASDRFETWRNSSHYRATPR